LVDLFELNQLVITFLNFVSMKLYLTSWDITMALWS